MKKIVSFSLAFLFNLSCINNYDKNLEQINVFENSHNKGELSEIVESVDCIFLETNDNCLVSKVQLVRSSDEYIFITDMPGRRLLQFRKDGSFVKQIGSKGRGPKEYTYISTFSVNEKLKKIFVASGSKLLCYDFDGKYINSKSYDYPIEYIEDIDEATCIITSQTGIKTPDKRFLTKTKLFRLDESLQYTDSLLLKSVVQNKPMFIFLPNSYLFSKIHKRTYFYYPILTPGSSPRDTLYEIKDFKVIPEFKLNFNENTTTENNQDKLRIRNIYNTKRYLFAEYSMNKEQKLFCIDLKGNEQWNLTNGFTDDVYNTGMCKLFPMNMTKRDFYSVKYGYEIHDKFEKVNEDDNPIILIVKLKD